MPQAALKERLLAAYFTDGADIGDPEVLAGCAADVGLDADVARRRLAGDEGVESLAVGLQRAAELGITAVPTYVLDVDVVDPRGAGRRHVRPPCCGAPRAALCRLAPA